MWNKIFLIYFLPSCIFFQIVLSSNNSKFNTLSKCIVKVSEIDLFYSPTVLLEYNQHKSLEENEFMNEMIDQLTSNNIPRLILNDKYDINDKIKLHESSWLVVLFYDDCDSLFSLDMKLFREKIKYLIIVYRFEMNVCREVAVQIGNEVMMFDVTFVIGEPNEYKIITFIPETDTKSCKIIARKATVINTCVNGTMKIITSFPVTSPSNYNKCVLKVGMGTLYPLSIIPNKDILNTYDSIEEIKGADYEIIKIIANQFNSTLELHYVKKMEENPFGQLDFIPFIVNGSLDVVAGGFYRIYGDHVEYSGIYARQAVFWLYTANRDVRSWQNLIEKIDGLYIFIIFYVIYSVIWYIVSKFDKQAVSLKNTWLYSWGALIGTSSLEDPETVKQKVLNLSYLIMCLHLSAYVSIQFYSFLTIMNPPEIFDTNEEIMKSGRVAYLRAASKYFVNDEKYIKFANASKDCDSFWDCSRQSLIRKGITLLLEGYFIYFQANTSIDDEATVLRVTENLLTVYYEMLIRSNSPYTKKFQDIIVRLFEAGIPEKLYREGIGILTVDKAKIAREHILANSYSCGAGCPITLEQIAGVFYLWLIGCGLSFSVFVIEFLIKKINIDRHIHIFNHADQRKSRRKHFPMSPNWKSKLETRN